VTSGAALKEEGLGPIEETNSDWVRLLRAKAVEIAIENGEVHIDDLRRFADAEGLEFLTKPEDAPMRVVIEDENATTGGE